MTKKQKNIIWLLLGVYVVLFIFATFNDLKIFQTITVVGNPVGEFFEKIASIPHALVLLLSSGIALGTCKKEKTIKSILLTLLNVIYFAAAALFGYGLASSYVPKFIAVLVPLVGVYIIYASYRLPKEHVKRWQKVALIAGLTFLFSTLIIETAKIFVGRVRPRSLNSDFSNFTRWYSVNSKKYLDTIQTNVRPAEELKSFPSGHSQWASISIIISTFAYASPRLEGKRFHLILAAVIWAVVIMFSRVWVGAHFATDTIVGAGITVGVFYIVQKLVIKEKY